MECATLQNRVAATARKAAEFKIKVKQQGLTVVVALAQPVLQNRCFFCGNIYILMSLRGWR